MYADQGFGRTTPIVLTSRVLGRRPQCLECGMSGNNDVPPWVPPPVGGWNPEPPPVHSDPYNPDPYFPDPYA